MTATTTNREERVITKGRDVVLYYTAAGKWSQYKADAKVFASYGEAQSVVAVAEKAHYASPGYSAGRGHANRLGWRIEMVHGL